jgi:hypothetical protein
VPYIITKKNGKRWDWPRWATPLPVSEVEKFHRDGKANGDCWTLKSPVTMRSIKVGACRTTTPSNLWGARRKRNGLGLWPFKKKAKRRVGDKTIYFVPTKSGGYVSKLYGARRRRRRR